MDASTSNLNNLVELPDDTRVFHDEAARSSVGYIHTRHQEKALHYAGMVAEIRHWKDARQPGPSRPSGAAANESDDADAGNNFSALMSRIYSMDRAN